MIRKQPFHAIARAIQLPLPVYSLYWNRDGVEGFISTCDRGRIERQMKSLAEQRVIALVYCDDNPAGSVSPASTTTPHQPYRVIWFD